MVILTVFFLFVIRAGRVINLIDFSVRFRFWKMNFFSPIDSTKFYDYVKVIKTFYSSPSTHTIELQIISLRSSILLT